MSTDTPNYGHTMALDRFSHAGATQYVAVFPGGSRGPARATREQAEADYTEAES